VGLRSRCLPAPKLKENTERLQLQSIQIFVGDSRDLYQFNNSADRVLLDHPAGLGTLHRHADARWRQTEVVQELSVLSQLLSEIHLGQAWAFSLCYLLPLL